MKSTCCQRSKLLIIHLIALCLLLALAIAYYNKAEILDTIKQNQRSCNSIPFADRKEQFAALREYLAKYSVSTQASFTCTEARTDGLVFYDSRLEDTETDPGQEGLKKINGTWQVICSGIGCNEYFTPNKY